MWYITFAVEDLGFARPRASLDCLGFTITAAITVTVARAVLAPIRAAAAATASIVYATVPRLLVTRLEGPSKNSTRTRLDCAITGP